MDVIDADWIKRRLTGRHGEKAALAKAMGIDLTKMSKVLKGERRVQSSEIPALLRFFESGLSEAAAEYTGPGSTEALDKDGQIVEAAMRLVAPDAARPVPYRITRAMPGFGLLKGDVVILDMDREPTSGDLVVATRLDPETQETRSDVLRWSEPWLLGDTTEDAPVQIKDTGEIAILGTLAGAMRGPGL